MIARVALTPARGEWPEAGEWKGLRAEDGERTASVGCPECGRLASLRDHRIASDGEVSPSLVCPHAGCPFHAWARLEGWEGEEST